MRRAPIVLSATVAGTAGILAFHAHAPSVSTATASVSATATPAATATATATASATPSATTSAGVGGTATGAAIDTRYGPAQVKVTVKDGRITAVQAVLLQSGDPRSAAISSYAEPILRQEVLSKQSAAIDAVSGATYTSASFDQSVQSALDKLGFKAAGGATATLQVPA